ncbi:MAG TPA: OmpH family outer membrane protein [Chlorobiota bacterium]|nr:OmpH family outer membrane protein [Chlorobiota bacterium]
MMDGWNGRWRMAVVLAMVITCWIQPASAQKIGYVSTDAIRDKYEPNKIAIQRLEQYVTEWREDLALKQKDIEELELEMKKNRLIWSDQEREAKEKELEDKRRERDKIAKERFEPGGEYDKQAEALLNVIWEKIYAAIQKVAAAEGYDIVWDKSTQPLIYVNAKYDITVKVMKELGIDSDELERKQQDIIDNDPRNKRQEEPRRRKSRRSSAAEEKEEPKPDATIKSVPTPDPVTPQPDSTKQEKDIPR